MLYTKYLFLFDSYSCSILSGEMRCLSFFYFTCTYIFTQYVRIPSVTKSLEDNPPSSLDQLTEVIHQNGINIR